MAQYQFDGIKVAWDGVKGHGFIFAKCEILYLSQWTQKHFI
jgi:hypothetical protein